MTFFFGSVVNLFNTFKTKFWPKEGLKRRRDSLEDEEEDLYPEACERLSKRPKWMTNATYPTRQGMAASGSKQPSKAWSTVPSKSSLPNVLSGGSLFAGSNGTGRKKTQDDVIEVIDLDSDEPKLESRVPLCDLKVQPRNKFEMNNHGGAISRTSHRNHSHERKHNGMHSDIFHSFTNGSLRLSKSCSVPKLTAVCESFQIDDRQTYSQLLEDYLKTNSATHAKKSVARDDLLQDWPLVSSLQLKKNKSPGKTSPECIDLTREERETPKTPRSPNLKPWCFSNLLKAETNEKIKLGRHRNNGSTRERPDLTEENKEVKPRVRLHMKPRSPPTPKRDVDSFEVQFEWPVARVNTLEKQLAQNSCTSAQWIFDIQKKYNEKERETQRQVEEAKLKKELYSEHNHKHLNEALEDRIRRHLSLTDVVLDDTDDEPPLPDLTEEMMIKVKHALKPGPPSQVLVEGFGQQLKRMDFKTLDKLNWLNDEVINFYMCLLIERGKQDKYMPVYAFNTFFYPKLLKSGYTSLRRWTKKVDIFSHKMILVPIHLGMHWCMATIDFRDQTLRYYDSMGGNNNQCLNTLRQYLEEESLDKKKIPYNTSNWKLENVKNIPQQMNGSDCGMFSCMFAEYLSRNGKLNFSQANMPYFRLKMVYEIITKQLLM